MIFHGGYKHLWGLYVTLVTIATGNPAISPLLSSSSIYAICVPSARRPVRITVPYLTAVCVIFPSVEAGEALKKKTRVPGGYVSIMSRA